MPQIKEPKLIGSIANYTELGEGYCGAYCSWGNRSYGYMAFDLEGAESFNEVICEGSAYGRDKNWCAPYVFANYTTPTTSGSWDNQIKKLAFKNFIGTTHNNSWQSFNISMKMQNCTSFGIFLSPDSANGFQARTYIGIKNLILMTTEE